MAAALEGFTPTALGLDLITSAVVYGGIARVSPETGNPHQDVRIALTGDGDGDVYYFNGTSWVGVSNNDGVVTGLAFGLDASNHPHIVYVVIENSSTSDTVSHWYHDGTSGETYGVMTSPMGGSINLSPDLGISGSPGKSNW